GWCRFNCRLNRSNRFLDLGLRRRFLDPWSDFGCLGLRRNLLCSLHLDGCFPSRCRSRRLLALRRSRRLRLLRQGLLRLEQLPALLLSQRHAPPGRSAEPLLAGRLRFGIVGGRGNGAAGTALAQFSLDLGDGSFDPVPLQFKTHERHFEDAVVNRGGLWHVFPSLSREPHHRHTDIRHRSRLSFSWTAWISNIRRHSTSRLSCWPGAITSSWRSAFSLSATRIASPYSIWSGVSFRRVVRTGAIGNETTLCIVA